jgi:hypothetical protein
VLHTHCAGVFTSLIREGVHQGYLLALPLFALAVHPMLQSITNCISGAVATVFANDSFFIVNHSLIAALYSLFEHGMASVGLKINPVEPRCSTGEGSSPNCALIYITSCVSIQINSNTKLSITTDGLKVLGLQLRTATVRHKKFHKIKNQTQHTAALGYPFCAH